MDVSRWSKAVDALPGVWTPSHGTIERVQRDSLRLQLHASGQDRLPPPCYHGASASSGVCEQGSEHSKFLNYEISIKVAVCMGLP